MAKSLFLFYKACLWLTNFRQQACNYLLVSSNMSLVVLYLDLKSTKMYIVWGHVRPPLLGWLLRCQKLTSWRYLWFLSFLLLCWYLMKSYVYHNRLLRFIVGSFNWLYSLNLRTWLLLWLNHFTNKLMN